MNPWATIAKITSNKHKKFLNGLKDCAESQRQQLSRILKSNATTSFGQRYDFCRLHNPDQFRGKVPIQSYDDIFPELEAQLQGESSLIAEPVLHIEPTSGSSGGVKLVPYAASSLQAFQAAIHPWLYDLARYYTQLDGSYFAISPAARSKQLTHNSIPIGASSENVYLGKELLQPLSGISLVPEQLAAITDMEHWQHLTLSYLLRAENLSLISVWSPTFITALLAILPQFAEQLLREIHDGTSSPLPGVPPFSASPSRATLVSSALSGGTPDTQMLWPDLQLISCWTHASAARFIPELRRLFPHSEIQGKGLLSTEGVVSIPLTTHAYPVLAVNSGFYEFLDDTGNSNLAHELVSGQMYEVVITVPGFYRYRSGDQVRIQGWIGATPQLEFIGRSGLSSDLVGEKLTDAFVAGCLQQIEGFAMIAPSLKPVPHYCLYVEQVNNSILAKVQAALQDNPQYAYACALGQLAPLHIIQVEQAFQKYQNWAIKKGQRLSDIKPPSLRPEVDWELRMNPECP